MKRTSIFSIILLLVITSCSASHVSITETATITPTSILPTNTPALTVVPTNTPETIDPFLSFPSVNCCKARTVEAGKYELPSWQEMPLTLEVSEGWGVLHEEGALLILLAGKGRNGFNDPSQVLVFIAAKDGDPQDILASIRNSPELTPIGEIIPTDIAGFTGLQFDASAKPNSQNKGDRENSVPPGAQILPALSRYFAPGFLWTTWTAEPRLRFVTLEVDEQVLLLQIESPPAEFDAFASDSDQVLQSLKFIQ